ncbi:hypothetical protein L9F63_000317, partial [Diploptera punctata]
MYCIKEPSLDLHDFIVAIFIALGEEICLVGAFAFFTGRGNIENIIKMLNEDFKEYPLQLKLKWDKKARIISKYIITIWLMWALLYAFTPLIKSLLGDAKNDDSVKRELPFVSWYPFDTNQSPVYETMYFVHTFGLQCGMVPVSVFYALFLILTMYIEQQFEFVSNSLKNMKNLRNKMPPEFKNTHLDSSDTRSIYQNRKEDYQHEPSISFENIAESVSEGAGVKRAGSVDKAKEVQRQYLRTCIQHHISTLRLVDELNDVVSIMVFNQLFITTMMLTGIAFEASNS